MPVALVTGYDGFLGRALTYNLVNDGWQVYGLSRHASSESEHVIPLSGDILTVGLGLKSPPKHVDTIFHLAGIVNLGRDKDGVVWSTNVTGTRNVIDYARGQKISDFRFCSTAYDMGKNPYEQSKAAAELMVSNSQIPRVTIIKPSIIVGSPDNPGTAQNINQWAGTVLRIARIHRRAEGARRQIQDSLALPPLELGLRMKGDPNSTLNLIPVDVVADEIIKLGEGTHYITNPNPPSVQEVTNEIGEAISLNIHIIKKFRPSPIEITLHKLLKSFTPYMEDEPPFPTVVAPDFILPKGYIRDTIKSFLSS